MKDRFGLDSAVPGLQFCVWEEGMCRMEVQGTEPWPNWRQSQEHLPEEGLGTGRSSLVTIGINSQTDGTDWSLTTELPAQPGGEQRGLVWVVGSQAKVSSPLSRSSTAELRSRGLGDTGWIEACTTQGRL